MYRTIRTLHLILGLVSSLFLLLYAVSALQMAHRVKLHPTVTEEDISLPSRMEARPLALQLMTERSIDGEFGQVQSNPSGFRFNVTRPGAQWTVTYQTATGQTHLHTERRDFLGMLNRLHHLNGLRHDDQTLNAWGWALVFVSVGLLLLGLTGVYLWFRLHNERTIGSILLAANLIVSLVLMIILRS